MHVFPRLLQDIGPPMVGDPFYESQENHNLIGVANIFLECLFHDVKLDYHVPIISQQGEVSLISPVWNSYLCKFTKYFVLGKFRAVKFLHKQYL